MAAVEYAIRSLLNASPVADAVDGIRPLSATVLDDLPVVAYAKTDTEDFGTFSGSADWQRATIQVDVFSLTFKEAEKIIVDIRTALHNYTGTVEGIQIGVCKNKGDSDNTEPPDVGDTSPIYRLSSEYLILFRGV